MWVHIPVVRVLVSYNLCCVCMQIRKIKLNYVIKASCAKKNGYSLLQIVFDCLCVSKSCTNRSDSNCESIVVLLLGQKHITNCLKH